MKAIILDTETTGVNQPRATQIAYIGIDVKDGQVGKVGTAFEQFFNPQKPISYGAMATTGICDEDVKDFPPHTSFQLPNGLEYIIGHNIDFDCDVLANADCDLSNVKRICTLALSRKYYPNMDSHSLMAMLYFLDYQTARAMQNKAHSALYDIYFTYQILAKMVEQLGVTSLEQLYQMSEEARIPDVINFGKHKGTLIKALPSDYVAWLLKQNDLDPYLRKALL